MATNIIITGKTGTPHISAGDDGALYASIFGIGDYILNIGNKFAFEKADANHISVEDGLLIMQGRYCRLANTELVEFESGTIGYNRKDTLVFEYSITDGFESVELVMIKGTPTEGTPEAPTLQQDDILSGTAVKRQVPLCHIEFTGTTAGNPVDAGYLVLRESPWLVPDGDELEY